MTDDFDEDIKHVTLSSVDSSKVLLYICPNILLLLKHYFQLFPKKFRIVFLRHLNSPKNSNHFISFPHKQLFQSKTE